MASTTKLSLIIYYKINTELRKGKNYSENLYECGKIVLRSYVLTFKSYQFIYINKAFSDDKIEFTLAGRYFSQSSFL